MSQKSSNTNSNGSRILFLKDELDSECMCKLVESIYEFNDTDDEYDGLISGYSREPIRLFINTPGGSAYNCLSLVDVIRSSKTPVHTIALNAFSAGIFVTMAGHKRFAYPNSTFVYHQLELDAQGGGLRSVRLEVDESYRVQNILKDFVLENTYISAKTLESVHKEQKDWYISAEEALALGIIDKII